KSRSRGRRGRHRDRSGVPRIALRPHMLHGIDAFPELLAQAAELEDRVELRLARRLFQEMNDLLGEGAVLMLGALLKPLVEIVREVLDVECRHEPFLRTASILEERGAGVNAP